MKAFTIVALGSILAVASARDVVLQHRALWKRETNLASFTGDLGGIAVTPITCSGDATRQFEVNGDTFVGFEAAAQRSCSIQHNACADAANSGGQSFTVADCDSQETQCTDTQTTATASCTGATASTNTTTAASTSSSTCASAKFRKHKQKH